MKKLTAALILCTTLVSTPAMAEAEVTNCEVHENIARAMMTARQYGYSIKEMNVKIDDTFTGGYDKVAKALLRYAFTMPRYNAERNKEDSVDSFGNHVYLQCMKTERKTRS